MKFSTKAANFFKELGYFLSSKYFLKNFGYMMGAVVLFLLVVFLLLLPGYTRHGEDIKVIDITNLTVEQANKMIKSLGLKLVVTDSSYNPLKNPGVIIEQIPTKGNRVKPKRTIYVTVNSAQPPLVSIYYNQVIAQDLDQVERKFKSMDIKIGKLKYVPGRAENTVKSIKQGDKILFREVDGTKGEKKPSEAQNIPRGSVVDLELYRGDDAEMKSIPSLICNTYEEAMLQILGNEFHIGNIYIDPSVGRDTTRAYIVRQSPRGGSEASMGTGIDIWLEKRKPVECDEE